MLMIIITFMFALNEPVVHVPILLAVQIPVIVLIRLELIYASLEQKCTRRGSNWKSVFCGVCCAKADKENANF
jgi:hypothetical protein